MLCSPPIAGVLLLLGLLHSAPTLSWAQCEGGPRLAQKLKFFRYSDFGVGAEFLRYTGLDLSDFNTRRQVACALIEANTLEELAQMLNTPVWFVSHYQKVFYGIFVNPNTGLSSIESMQELYNFLESRVRMQTRLDAWQRRTGFPRLPLRNTNRQHVEEFFRNLQTDNPDIYGDSVTLAGMKLNRPKIDISHDPAQLAEWLTSAQSMSELADHFHTQVWNNEGRLDLMRKDEVMYQLYEFVKAMVETGAIDLLENHDEVPAPISEQNADGLDISDDCQYIMDLIHLVVQKEEEGGAMMYYIYGRTSLQTLLGTKLLDDADLQPVACQFSEVRSIADLSKLVGERAQSLQYGFDNAREAIVREVGTFQDILDAERHLLGMKRFCQKTNGMSLPLDVSESEMLLWLETHARPLISSPASGRPWPGLMLDRFIPLDRLSPEEIYQVYAGSQTVYELMDHLGVDVFAGTYDNICLLTHIMADALVVAIPAARRLHEMGVPLPLDISA